MMASLALCLVAPAKPPIEVFVGTKPVAYAKARPLWKGQTMLVPLQETVAAMGGSVVPGPLRRKTFVVQGRHRVELALNGGRSRVNGIPRRLKSVPWISRGQVVVPTRFFSEALAAVVVTDARKGLVRIIPRN